MADAMDIDDTGGGGGGGRGDRGRGLARGAGPPTSAPQNRPKRRRGSGQQQQNSNNALEDDLDEILGNSKKQRRHSGHRRGGAPFPSGERTAGQRQQQQNSRDPKADELDEIINQSKTQRRRGSGQGAAFPSGGLGNNANTGFGASSSNYFQQGRDDRQAQGFSGQRGRGQRGNRGGKQRGEGRGGGQDRFPQGDNSSRRYSGDERYSPDPALRGAPRGPRGGGSNRGGRRPSESDFERDPFPQGPRGGGSQRGDRETSQFSGFGRDNFSRPETPRDDSHDDIVLSNGLLRPRRGPRRDESRHEEEGRSHFQGFGSGKGAFSRPENPRRESHDETAQGVGPFGVPRGPRAAGDQRQQGGYSPSQGSDFGRGGFAQAEPSRPNFGDQDSRGFGQRGVPTGPRADNPDPRGFAQFAGNQGGESSRGERRKSKSEVPYGFQVKGAAKRRSSAGSYGSHDDRGSPAANQATQEVLDPELLRLLKSAADTKTKAWGRKFSETEIDIVCSDTYKYFQKHDLISKSTSKKETQALVDAWFRYCWINSGEEFQQAPPPPELLELTAPPSPSHNPGEETQEQAEEQEHPFRGSTMAPQFGTGDLTSNLGLFLNQINGFLKVQNAAELAKYLVVLPPFNDTYNAMIQELRQTYPKGAEDALEEKCTRALTVASSGLNGSASWTMFIKFMVEYLGYLRDVSLDESKYLETYEQLYELQKRANSALNHTSLGHMMVETVITVARAMCKLAIGLDKQPELIAHLKSSKSGGEDGSRETLPERAAETIRQALTTCLNDRTSDLDQNGKPEGKKRGIYIIANICLKIFFQCRKTRNAEMIFTTIRNNSPPLAAYAKRERVTYLYYLGRYWFQNNHFHRAQLALEEAYNESPTANECIRQRRHILTYLITCNIIMGRFPSIAIFQRPEAQGLQERFMPIMQAIRSGNLTLFRQYLDWDSPAAPWFLHFRILLQLRNRCEVLVWRSLIRKVWILNGTRYEAGAKTAPLVDINDLVRVFRFLEQKAQKPQEAAYIDPDFDPEDYSHEDPADVLLPTPASLESILSSLIDQDFLRGFIAHRQQKFVITGAKQTGGDVLAAGFPSPWKVIQLKVAGLDEVPGWKKTAGNSMSMGAGAFGGGMVVNLSGARAAGAA